MRKGPLNLLGRKNQSLFDTSIQIKDMENAELVLGSAAIPESGTARVRARPTVSHHTSSSFDSFQGHAVPTPKVPLLPQVNGPKINGSVSGDHLSNGSALSVADLEEGEIFIPPPPSMAPPPPPPFIPPPDFMGDFNSLDLKNLQPPSMTAPKLTSWVPSMEEEDLSSLKPPPMAPPKPPSTGSSGSGSSLPISSPSPVKVLERPKFVPPQPPTERQNRTYKIPPPKPTRLSSILTFDSPPQSPAPPPPVQTPTLSTFNPQNTAKLYNIPKTSILSKYEDGDTRPKQMLLLEDSGSVRSPPVLVQVDGKAAKVATLPKPVSKDVQELKENLQISQPSPSLLPVTNKEIKMETVSSALDVDKSLGTQCQTSPQLHKVNSTSEISKDKPFVSHNGKFSPLLDRKLRNLKNSETNGARDGPAASPLALLMAAKEREKHRTSQFVFQDNSAKKNEQPSASIHPSDWSPNSFIVTPRSSSSSSLTSQDSPVENMQTSQTPQKSSTPAVTKDQMPFTSLALNNKAASTSVTNLVTQKEDSQQRTTESQSTQHEDNNGELCMPLLPPPPEFGDLDDIIGPPPSLPPPDPPMKIAPTQAPPPLPPSPKPKPPAAPKLPPSPQIEVKPMPQVQTKPKTIPSQLPSALSPSQATLLSILQKKMLEMDHKMAPVKEPESSSDDWGTAGPDDNNKALAVPKPPRPQSKSYPAVNKAATLDMRELEGKVVKKHQETSATKVPTSNGPSKHQHGMTFTVRPGTKQPITLVSKGDS